MRHDSPFRNSIKGILTRLLAMVVGDVGYDEREKMREWMDGRRNGVVVAGDII